MRLRLVPDDTKFAFLKMRRVCIGLSVLAILASVAMLFVQGLNFGIDFRGGSSLEIRAVEPIPIGEIRDVANGLGLGEVIVQEFGAPTDFVIRIAAQAGDGDNQTEAAQRVADAMMGAFEGLVVLSTDVVGPAVSGELITASTIAVLLSLVAVLIYIWLRFEWQFSIGAIVALAHDVMLTMGVFAVTQIEFNLASIAAILTIVGYSLNDTVVVFDRVRENLRKYKKMGLEELLDHSINETLSRTLMTSLTTLIALFALYGLGGENIRGFTFAMIWGIVVGTYSSIFIASPILLHLGVKRDWSKRSSDPTAGSGGVQFGSPDAP
jgi:preprotein translocase subunit SecF